MGKRRKRELGSHQHAEGQHGETTHRRFVEMLQESSPREAMTEKPTVEGHHRLREDREQHDVAEKNSEKIEAIRDVRRGNADENVLDHARIPHEGDAS